MACSQSSCIDVDSEWIPLSRKMIKASDEEREALTQELAVMFEHVTIENLGLMAIDCLCLIFMRAPALAIGLHNEQAKYLKDLLLDRISDALSAQPVELPGQAETELQGP